ncbi:MAG: Ig-like domain repeat protein, partial [Gemmatimonadetes bacterium]|nr:Ig-like domain repeat protein [Gemmatimonadota bacterium]
DKFIVTAAYVLNAGSITIIKDAVPNDAQDFSFTTSENLTGFTLDDDSDPTYPNTKLFSSLTAGTYAVTETTVSGWNLSNILCEGMTSSTVQVGSDSGFDAGDTGVSINLAVGENVTCTFTNTGNASLAIQKQTVGGTAEFHFEGTGAGVDADIVRNTGTANPTAADAFVISGADLGVKYVQEALKPGWALTGIACTANGATVEIGRGGTAFTDGGSAGFEAGDNTVKVTVGAGDTPTCTFTNTKQASIKITKDATPNHAQDFSFTTSGTGLSAFTLDDDADPTNPSSRTYSGLLPGTYGIDESATADWALTDIVCTGATNSTILTGTAADFDAGDTGVSITLAAGEDIECTFSNQGLPRLTIAKIASNQNTGNSDGDPDFYYQAHGKYAMTVTNNGPGPTNGTSMTVTDALPSALSFYATGSGSDWDCDAAGQTVTCTSTAVIAAEGGTSSVDIWVTANTVGDDVSNTASVIGGGDTSSADSDAEVVDVIKAVTAPSLTQDKAPTEYGQNVKFTATVTVETGKGGGTPAGNVTFKRGTSCAAGTALSGTNPVALDGGIAELTVNDLPLGDVQVWACYGGNTSYEPSEDDVTHAVTAVTTSTTIAVAPITQQYSDSVVFTATVTPKAVLDQSPAGTVTFTVNGTAFGPIALVCTTTACSADLRYQVTHAAGTDVVSGSAVYTSTSAYFLGSSTTADATVDVTKENATIFDMNVTPSQILVGQSAVLTFKVRQALDSTSATPLGGPGDISLASASVQLTGVLDSSQKPSCSVTSTGVSGGGYDGVKAFTCTVSFTAADTYDTGITVDGDYFTGTNSTVIQVTDPSLGFATGGGWYLMDGDRVNFGFMAKSTVNNRKTVFQGSFLLIRHMANGDIVKVKSNVFDGYSIKALNPGGQVTFTGKANYSVNGSAVGNYSFTGYGRDVQEPGTGFDRFGIYYSMNGNVVATSPTVAGLTTDANSRVLQGGNIQVPQPQKK